MVSSIAQLKLLQAAASGQKTKADIDQKTAKKILAEGVPKNLPEKISKSNGMMPPTASSAAVAPQAPMGAMRSSPGFEGSSAMTAMMKAESDGSDMAKQLLAQINEMSEKLNSMINSDKELEDWVDSKIVSAKKDLEDIAGYLSHNEDAQKSIQGGTSTPEKTVARVDGMAKATNPDPMVFGQNKVNFEAAHKQFVKKHGSTILALGRGEKIKPEIAAEYNQDRGNLPVYVGINQRDIPQKILSHQIHQGEPKTLNYAEMNKIPSAKPSNSARSNSIDAEIVDPLALPPATKSMEALTNPKSLLQKMDDCTKCMRKNLQKSNGEDEKKELDDFHRQKIADYASRGESLPDWVQYPHPDVHQDADAYNEDFGGDEAAKAAHEKKWLNNRNYRARYNDTAENLAWNKAFDYAKAGKIRLAGKNDYHPEDSGFHTDGFPTYAIDHPEYGEMELSLYDHAGNELYPKTHFRPSHKEILQEMKNPTRMQFWPVTKPEEDETSDLQKSSKKKSKPFHGYNKKKHARSGGLNDSYRKKLNRETGSNLKRPVTKKNVKPGSKAAKRRKSFCARMSGVKGPTSKDGKLTPKGAALKRWRCSKSLNKSESVPLELRAQKVLKSLEQSLLDKSNTIKPFGENIYDEVKNLGRKMKRTGEVVEGAGKNVAVQQTKPTAKKQAAMIAEKDEKKNKKQPVAMFDLKDVPEEHQKAVYDAYVNKKPHPLMYLAVKIKPSNRKKAVVPKELLPLKEKKSRKKTGEEQPVILGEEDLKESYGAKTKFAKAHEVLSKLEKRFSLKGALTAGAIGASALAGGAQASPESDLHSQLSNLNVMGEYHTPKGGSQAVLKEPSQLKADPSHPSASYSREGGSSSSVGNFYGPDAAKAKELLQNYDASSNKPFAKNDKLVGGKGDSKKISDFDPLQVMSGKKVEMEHTKDPAIAQEITKDHLSENPKYYSKLKSAGLADELKKANQVLSKLEKRCWDGYKPVAGKKPYSKGSCEPIGKSEDKTDISAPAMESGRYQGEKLDAYHHNRLGNEYKELARKAYSSGDKYKAASLTDKSNYHFSMADKKGYKPPKE